MLRRLLLRLGLSQGGDHALAFLLHVLGKAGIFLFDKSGGKAEFQQGHCERRCEIIEIRASATPDWSAAKISVELVFLIDRQSLPSQPLAADPPATLLAEIANLDAQRLAELLDDATIDPTRRNALWQRLVDAWSLRAKPTGCVQEVTALAVPLNEFSRLDEISTPELDLEYLSG